MVMDNHNAGSIMSHAATNGYIYIYPLVAACDTNYKNLSANDTRGRLNGRIIIIIVFCHE